MRIKGDHLGVVVEQVHEDKIGNFRFDPMYNPTEHARVYGEVKYVPTSISEGWNINMDFFQKGDRVYFHYDAISDGGTIRFDDDDGQTVYLLPLRDVYLRVRDGVVTPRAGKCVFEPFYDTDDPSCEVRDEEVDGKIVKAVVHKTTGFIVSTNPKAHDRIAVVRLIGDPLQDQPELSIKAGDKVFREEGGNQRYKVEGEELFIDDSSEIMGVILV